MTGTRQGGFTLMEVLVAIAIIALFSSMAAFAAINRIRDARVTGAQAEIASLETALKGYHLDNGFYPTTEQGLVALIARPSTRPIPAGYKKGGYWERDFIPKDPWGGQYHYLSPGLHGDIDIWSLGSDLEVGGVEDAADLGNWDLGRR